MHPESTTQDTLSLLLQRLQLRTEIIVHAEVCGQFAVDTSGSRRVAFHLIERGEAWLHIAGQVPQQLFAGDFVVFPHDAPHRIANSAEPPPDELVNAENVLSPNKPITSMLCGFFEFTANAAWPLLSSLPQAIVMDLSRNAELAGTRELIQLIMQEMRAQKPGSAVVLQQLANSLFIHVLRAEMQRSDDSAEQQSGVLAAMAHPRLGKALQRIHSTPGHRWDLDQLADVAGMSRTAFITAFKTALDTTPMRYVTEWRMQEAIELLTRSELSMLAIAEQCGYSSEVAFRKAFRSVTGKPPGAVRRQG